MIFNEGLEQFSRIEILYLVGHKNRCSLKLKVLNLDEFFDCLPNTNTQRIRWGQFFLIVPYLIFLFENKGV